MSEQQQESLSAMLADVQKALRQAKQSLASGSATNLFANLKTIHNVTTKCKNSVVDMALATMDAEAMLEEEAA